MTKCRERFEVPKSKSEWITKLRLYEERFWDSMAAVTTKACAEAFAGIECTLDQSVLTAAGLSV